MSNETTGTTFLAIVEHGYQVWLWLDERVNSFPVAARRQLGHRILDACLDSLTATTEATYLSANDRIASLYLVNRKLTLLRILLRGARERKYLSVGQHEYLLPRVDQWGKQIGTWLRAERSKMAAKAAKA